MTDMNYFENLRLMAAALVCAPAADPIIAAAPRTPYAEVCAAIDACRRAADTIVDDVVLYLVMRLTLALREQLGGSASLDAETVDGHSAPDAAVRLDMINAIMRGRLTVARDIWAAFRAARPDEVTPFIARTAYAVNSCGVVHQ